MWLGVAGTFVTAGVLAVLAHALFDFDWRAAAARRHRARPDRPGRRLLGARSPRGGRADRHPARGRVRRERPGRHRVDARDPGHQRRRLGRRHPRGRPSSWCRWWWASPSESPAAWACAGCCSTCRCPTRRSTPCGPSRSRSWCTASRRSPTGPASSPCCSPGSWSATPARRTSARSSASPRPPASLGEIVAFTVLGLSIPISEVFGGGRAWTGLALAALLILLVRPLFVGLLIAPIRLRRGERAFVLWAGLKGAVPILLGTYVVAEGRRRCPPDLRRDLRGRAGVGGGAGRAGADLRPAGGTSGCAWSSRSRGPSACASATSPRDSTGSSWPAARPPTARRSRTSRSRRTCGSAW